MGNIAFNLQIGNMLKAKYSLSLAILPFSLMFASFLPLWVISKTFAGWLGVSVDEPVLDSGDAGMTWLILFLMVMVFLMIAGYLLGWVLNAFISRYIFNWDKDKIQRVYLQSQVPDRWLKTSQSLVQVENGKMEEWQEKRKQGVFKFVLTQGVLAWGVIMFCAMALGPALFSKEPVSIMALLLQALIWTLGGALFGYGIWFSTERQFKKYKDSIDHE